MVVVMFKSESVPIKFPGGTVPVTRRLTRRSDGNYAMSKADAANFNREVDDAKRSWRNLPSPQQIEALLKKLNLTQRRASLHFGGGARSFQKYVKGTQIPSEAISKLLWLILAHPELLVELESQPTWWKLKS